MKKVGLLFDSVSKNTGDEAVGIALQQVFETIEGVSSTVVDPFSFLQDDYDILIIGGGQLLRAKGDDFYDHFRVKGEHILNAIGLLNPVDDLGYLKDYKFVSARTIKEVSVLKDVVPDAKVIPDITMLLDSSNQKVPAIRKKHDEKIIGIHLVPYTIQKCPEIVNFINSIGYKKVFIPFTHYNQDKNFMASLPLDMKNSVILPELSPLQLHKVLGQTDINIVSSLHASIFSLAQNTPFLSLDQEKVTNYLSDRGLEDAIYGNTEQLKKSFHYLLATKVDYGELIKAEKAQLGEAINQYKNIINSTPVSRKRPEKYYGRRNLTENLKMQNQLLKSVVDGRDRLIGQILSDSDRLKASKRSHEYKISELEQALKSKNEDLKEAREELNKVKHSKSFRTGYFILHPQAFLIRMMQLARPKINKHLRKASDFKVLQTVQKTYDRESNLNRKIYRDANTKLAVIIHLYFKETWPDFARKLKTLDKVQPYDLFITLPKINNKMTQEILLLYPKAHIFIVPNHGRDVLPFLTVAKLVKEAGYEYLLKLHSKKSTHRTDGRNWFTDLLDNLLPDKPSTLKSLIKVLESKDTAVVGPAGHYVSLKVNFRPNKAGLNHVLYRMYPRKVREELINNHENFGFFAGTMFWIRIESLTPILERRFAVGDFAPERGQIDATLAHALERAFCIVPELEAKTLYEIGPKGVKRIKYKTDNIPDWSDVERPISES